MHACVFQNVGLFGREIAPHLATLLWLISHPFLFTSDPPLFCVPFILIIFLLGLLCLGAGVVCFSVCWLHATHTLVVGQREQSASHVYLSSVRALPGSAFTSSSTSSCSIRKGRAWRRSSGALCPSATPPGDEHDAAQYFLQVAPHTSAATMWRRIYFFLILLRIYFALSPSYLHPDENFQGPEVIAGQYLPNIGIGDRKWK
jgi:hypothetical protein